MDNLEPLSENMPKARPSSLWSMAMRRLGRQRSSRIGLFLLGSLIFIAIFAKQIAPYDPTEILIGKENVRMRASPCIHLLGCPESEPQHIMGTDSYARDFFSRVIYGTRISLFIGMATIRPSLIVEITASLGSPFI